MCCCLKMILDYGNYNVFLRTLNVYIGKDGEISICDQTREIREYAYAYNRGFFICLSYRELHALNTVHHITKPHFLNFSTKHLLESILVCFFLFLGFLKRLLIPRHLPLWHFKSLMPS